MNEDAGVGRRKRNKRRRGWWPWCAQWWFVILGQGSHIIGFWFFSSFHSFITFFVNIVSSYLYFGSEKAYKNENEYFQIY